jgi:hypothetical protein
LVVLFEPQLLQVGRVASLVIGMGAGVQSMTRFAKEGRCLKSFFGYELLFELVSS